MGLPMEATIEKVLIEAFEGGKMLQGLLEADKVYIQPSLEDLNSHAVITIPEEMCAQILSFEAQHKINLKP